MIPDRTQRDPLQPAGTYYLETGYGIPAPKVIYDRKHSTITGMTSHRSIWTLLDGYDWLHLSGITHPGTGPQLPRPHHRYAQGGQKKGLTAQL